MTRSPDPEEAEEVDPDLYRVVDLASQAQNKVMPQERVDLITDMGQIRA